MQNDAVKNAEELALMRRAAAIIDDVYDIVLSEIKEGVTETQIALLIRESVSALGGEDVSFDTIVAFGESGCEPHHVPTDKKLEQGMLVTVDMGAIVSGYCSDFTRTFAFGKCTEEQTKIYSIVYNAQKAGLKAVKAGVRCADADAASRDYISERGYGEYYVHGTGHGVGKLIHEAPTLNAKSEETLEDNMVVTVEPGIYIPGEMGVRIEDMLIVGEEKPLSRHSTELITIQNASRDAIIG